MVWTTKLALKTLGNWELYFQYLGNWELYSQYMGMAIGQWKNRNWFLGLVVGLLDLRWDQFRLGLSKE